jgi:uncharacterized protein (DUF302 family)
MITLKIDDMSYYMNAILHYTGYDEAVALATRELQKEGFGVLTQIDVKQTLKQKIDADFRPYIILGACNPHFAHKALQLESKLGALLPCNVVIEQLQDGSIEVSAVDPIAMMSMIENRELKDIANEVKDKIARVIQEVAKEES